LDCRFLIIFHQATVFNNICTEDGGEFALKTFICHNSTPNFKVSNQATQYMDYPKKRKSQMRNQIRFRRGRAASGQLEQENQK
jgi:hypothetical protein